MQWSDIRTSWKDPDHFDKHADGPQQLGQQNGLYSIVLHGIIVIKLRSAYFHSLEPEQRASLGSPHEDIGSY